MSDMTRRLTDEQLTRLRANYYLPTARTEELLDEASQKVTEANDSMIVVDHEPTELSLDNHQGAMLALFVPPDVADTLAIDGGEPPQALHVTLAYLPMKPEEFELEQLKVIVSELAKTSAPLTGEISGVGLFTGGENPVTYASVDVPALPDFRQRVVAALDAARDSIGVEVSRKHGYTPHITLAYDDRRDLNLPVLPVTFTQLSLAAGGELWNFNFTTDPEAAAVVDQPPAGQQAEDELISRNRMTPQAQIAHRFTTATFPGPDGQPRCLLCGGGQPDDGICTSGPTEAATAVTTMQKLTIPSATWTANPVWNPATYTTSTASTTFVEPIIDPPVTTKAFVTDVDGKTILTAQADLVLSLEKRVNEHYMRMRGRFVGADAPNRNMAYWSSADLELGQHTVANGPLNWLHEARHIIGTIDQARFVTRDEQQMAEYSQPFIEASSVLWKWIYPDEAWVIQHANDAGKLWYSMECISDTVRCAGDNGCGVEVAYGDYCRGINGTCEHMLQRSAVRHFQNPTFLGGAVIVPPVRPGWADADLAVMNEAASLAEKAYDQAGKPDVSATEWEQLMAQVVNFARH